MVELGSAPLTAGVSHEPAAPSMSCESLPQSEGRECRSRELHVQPYRVVRRVSSLVSCLYVRSRLLPDGTCDSLLS